MYGPIANLPGYNPNATYLPPGVAAPSSYPSRTAPTRKFYDMPQLPGVSAGVSSSDLYGQGGLASSDYPAGGGISGGIGGNAGGVDSLYGFQFPNNGSMDGREYAFLNNFAAPPTRQTSTNSRTLQPFDIQPNALTEADISNLGRMPDVPGWNFDNFVQSQQMPLEGPNPSRLNNSQAWEDGGLVYSAQQQPNYGSYDTRIDPSYYSAGLSSPAKYADANGVINTSVVGYHPSLLQDPLGYLNSKANGITAEPNSFTFGNGLQALTRFLGPLSTPASAVLGWAGVGNTSTGNSVLDLLATPSFGAGMPNTSKAGVMTNPGATAVDWSGGDPGVMAGLDKVYGQKSVYDPNGTGWQTAPSTVSAPVDLGGTFGNGPAPDYNWSGASNDFMQGATFGAGRFDAGSTGFDPSSWQNYQSQIDNWRPQDQQLSISPVDMNWGGPEFDMMRWGSMYGSDGIDRGNQPGS